MRISAPSGGYEDVVFVARDADARLRQECLDAESHVLSKDFVGLQANPQRGSLPEEADTVSKEGEHLGELVFLGACLLHQVDAYLDYLVDAYAGFDRLDDTFDDAIAVFGEVTLLGGRGPTGDGRAPGVHPVALVDGAVDPAAHHVSGLCAVQAEARDGGAGEVVDGVAVGNGDHVEAASGLGDHVGGICSGLGLGLALDQALHESRDGLGHGLARVAV